MTMTLRSNSRHTTTVNELVHAAITIAALQARIDELTGLRDRLQSELISAGLFGHAGESIKIVQNSRQFTLTLGESKSVKRACSADELLDYGKQHGWKVTSQAPEVIAPATLRAKTLEGIVPESVAIVETTHFIDVAEL